MTRQRRPLLLTTDTDLLDELLGMAAAVGVAVDVAVEPTICRPQWTEAPLVLVGADLAHTMPRAALEPRPGVLLVTRGSPGDDLHAAAAEVGADDVVGLPSGEGTLLDRLANIVEPAVRARVIGVLAGRGGAGASVLATGLALTAATRDGPAWLIDLDPLGGGADAGVGAELSNGARWADLGVLTGRLSTAALRAAVPDVHGVSVVAADARSTGELAAGTVRAVIAAASRGAGTVVVDLARHRTAARDEAIAAADVLIVVVPAEIRSVLAAKRLITGLGAGTATMRVVVRMVPGALPAREVARAVGVPLAGELADEVPVREALQVGDAAGLVRGTDLARLCRTLLDGPIAARAAA